MVPQILGAAVKKLAVLAVWCPRFVHSFTTTMAMMIMMMIIIIIITPGNKVLEKFTGPQLVW